MTLIRLVLFALCALNTAASAAPSSSGAQEVVRRTLDNGIEIVVLPDPDGRQLGVFTFLPIGLVHDEANQTQYSHLLEHLIIRSTHTDSLGGVNAETLADHMRLDFLGQPHELARALQLHRTWLTTKQLPAEQLPIEITRIQRESDYAAENGFAHKLAWCAWAQVWRYGLDHVSLKADITNAKVNDLARKIPNRMLLPGRVLICIVGDVDGQQAMATAVKAMSDLTCNAAAPSVVPLPPPSYRVVSWDISARHLVLAWLVPHERQVDIAVLTTAAVLLMQRTQQDVDLQQACGPILAGTDVVIPEGRLFYISCSLADDAQPQDVRERLLIHLRQLSTDSAVQSAVTSAPFLRHWFIRPDFTATRAQAVEKHELLEMNLALFWISRQYQYADYLPMISESLGSMNSEHYRSAVGVNLLEQEPWILYLHADDEANAKPAATAPTNPSAKQPPAKKPSYHSGRAAWFEQRTSGWIGAWIGTVFGGFGAVIGLLVSRGKGRRVVQALLMAMACYGLVSLTVAAIAFLRSQPFHVYYAFLLPGILLTVLPLSLFRGVCRRFEDIELRKMRAMDTQ